MVIRAAAMLLMVLAAIHDIRKRELTRWLLAAAGVVALAALVAGILEAVVPGGAEEGEERAMAALVAVLLSLLPGAALLAVSFLSREGLGYGDGLLMLLLGPAFGGERTAAGVCLAFFFSAVCSMILLLARRVGRKSRLPFVPFLASAMGVMCVAIR